MRATVILAVCISVSAYAGGGRGGGGSHVGSAPASRGFSSSVHAPTMAAPAQHSGGHAYNPGGPGQSQNHVFQGLGGYQTTIHSSPGAVPPVASPAPRPPPGREGDRHEHRHHRGDGFSGYYGYGYGYGYRPYGYGYGYYGYGAYGSYYPYGGYYTYGGGYPPGYVTNGDYSYPAGYQGEGGVYVDPNNPEDRELMGEQEPEPADESAGPGQLYEVAPQKEEPAPAVQPQVKAAPVKPAKPEREPDVFHWVDEDGVDHYSTNLPDEARGKATKMGYDGSLVSWTPVTTEEAKQQKPAQQK